MLGEVGDFGVHYNADNAAIPIHFNHGILRVERLQKSPSGIYDKLLEGGFILAIQFSYNQLSIDGLYFRIHENNHTFRDAQADR